MTRETTATVTANYEITDKQDGRFHLKWGSQGVFYYLYPAVNARIRVLGGTLQNKKYFQFEVSEFVSFNGSDRARAKFPVVSILSTTIDDTAFDKNGNSLAPTIRRDPETNELISDTVFYGGVSIRYKSTGYRYDFFVNQTPPSSYTKLQLWAYYQGSTASISVDGVDKDEVDIVELYTVTSSYVTDKTGQWEKPPGLSSGDLSYPDILDAPVRPAGEQPRTHLRATIDKQGIQRSTDFYKSRLKPYQFDTTYTPEYTFSRASPPSGFEQIFLDVNWNAIENEVRRKYPGVTING